MNRKAPSTGVELPTVLLSTTSAAADPSLGAMTESTSATGAPAEFPKGETTRAGSGVLEGALVPRPSSTTACALHARCASDDAHDCGCPYCRGRRATPENNLATAHLELARRLDRAADANGYRVADLPRKGGRRKHLFRCERPDHPMYCTTVAHVAPVSVARLPGPVARSSPTTRTSGGAAGYCGITSTAAPFTRSCARSRSASFACSNAYGVAATCMWMSAAVCRKARPSSRVLAVTLRSVRSWNR